MFPIGGSWHDCASEILVIKIAIFGPLLYLVLCNLGSTCDRVYDYMVWVDLLTILVSFFFYL